ncbi:MAG: UbiD family decarboxylase [Dehalococcoidia bacterium]|nr:UbiD family decarboxylase [Dehalococcoidia bacterium]
MPKDLRTFVSDLAEQMPADLVQVEQEIDPSKFEASALLQNLENAGKFPCVLWQRPRNLNGRYEGVQLISNVFATRKRMALALGLPPEKWRMDLSLEYSRRENNHLQPVVVGKAEAPVKEIVRIGEEASLFDLPVVRGHRLDPAPFLNMQWVMKDPEGGFYNLSHHRAQMREPRHSSIFVLQSAHNGAILEKYHRQGKPCPIVGILGHHPAFFLGGLTSGAFGVDEYTVIGGVLGEPLRLVESETWGKDFLVPADAEIIVEGEIPPGVEEMEGPYGEFMSYYGGESMQAVLNVKAITYRSGPIMQYMFIGHADAAVEYGVPLEGSLYNAVTARIPRVTAVHLPLSGNCRFHIYAQIDKRIDGEPVTAAWQLLTYTRFGKLAIMVDTDIDIYNERQVLWAVASRVQADRQVHICREMLAAGGQDPSSLHFSKSTKMVIDATKPLDRPFAQVIDVPKEALEKCSLEKFLSQEALERAPSLTDDE